MAARLGNVIYWTCCGVTALCPLGMLVGVYDVLTDGSYWLGGTVFWGVVAPIT